MFFFFCHFYKKKGTTDFPVGGSLQKWALLLKEQFGCPLAKSIICKQIPEKKGKNKNGMMHNLNNLDLTLKLDVQKGTYSRTSVARPLMVVYHGCFEIVLESLGKHYCRFRII